jgi:hypothetical protein
MGRSGRNLLSFYLGARRGFVVNQRTGSLILGKGFPYPFYRRMGRPRVALDGCREEKISCPSRF